MNQRSRHDALISALCIASLIALFAYSASLVFKQPTWGYSDDWEYVNALSFSDRSAFFHWLLAQYMDHRIPIQKLIQFTVLKFSGFNYRYLIFLNLVTAATSAILFIQSAQIFRGRSSIGDIIIPLIMLNPGLPPFYWAFQFQFISSTFFLSLFLFLFSHHARDRKNLTMTASLVTCMLCAACGLNGLIIASALLLFSAAFLGACWHVNRQRPSAWILVFLTITAAQAIALWLSWTPSAASSTTGLPPLAILRMALELIPVDLANYLYTGTTWKLIFFAIFVFTGAAAALVQMGRRRWNIFPIVACLLSTSFLIMTIAAGRSKMVGDWQLMSGLHYAMLTIPIPILCWIAISNTADDVVVENIGLLLILFFGQSYLENFQARHSALHDSRQHYSAVSAALASDPSAQDIADQFIRDFWWKDDLEGKRLVANYINTLRNDGYWPLKSFVDVSSTTHKQLQPKIIDLAQEKVEQNLFCNYDEIDSKPIAGQITLQRSQAHTFSGWLLSKDGSSVPAEVTIQLIQQNGNQGWAVSDKLKIQRKDIVQTHGNNPDLITSGFDISTNLSPVPPGGYHLLLAYRDGDATYTCDNGHTVSIQ
jgi:hypothetical protein